MQININNLIQVGSITQVQTGKALVKVDLLGRETPWLPVLQQANSFARRFISLRAGEQVVVLAGRYVVGSIFNQQCKEPTGSHEAIELTEYEDGTRVSYDSNAKRLTIKASGDVNIECQNATVIATQNITMDGNMIHLNQGKGVVTGACLCKFDGLPHSDISLTVTAGK